MSQEPTSFSSYTLEKEGDDGPKGVLKLWEFLMISKYNNNCILNGGNFKGEILESRAVADI